MKQPSQFIVVDDDPFNNMVSKYVIASVAPTAGIQLFEDPEKALESIKNEYDQAGEYPETILFLDINMPAMSGWEFIDEISVFPDGLLSRVSIFILSSSIDPEDAKSAGNNPLVKGYYSKPLTKEILRTLTDV